MSDAARSIPRVVGPDLEGKETANQKWRRIARKRIQRVLKGLDGIGKLAIRRTAYSEEEARQIVAALRVHVDDVEAKLIPKTQTTFSFDE